MVLIAGILHITNKIYGKKGKQSYYKCYPDKNFSNIVNEPFLVPYENKITFSKNLVSKYVIINYSMSPIIAETLGNVDDMPAFCYYLLHCNNLIHSFKNFNEVLRLAPLVLSLPLAPPQIPCVYSVDPLGCKDIDDAFSITETTLRVYISNVPEILKKCGVESLLTKRTSTVYFPTFNYSMLPSILSEGRCSLVANTPRESLCMSVSLASDSKSVSFSRDVVCVTENLHYESEHHIVLQLIDTTKTLNNKIKLMEVINDSHDAIQYLMLLFNTECAKVLSSNPNTIYRILVSNKFISDKFINEEFFRGEYTRSKIIHSQIKHLYVHASSPIRRLVDLYNCCLLNNYLMDQGGEFESEFIIDLDLINENEKKIKKISNKAFLLYLFMNDPDKVYEGTVIGKEKDKLEIFIAELKKVFSVKIESDLDLLATIKCRVYVFKDEFNFYKKIRLCVL